VRPSGRVASGVRGMKFAEGDHFVGMEVLSYGQTLFSVTENGFGKRTSIDEYPVHKRGGINDGSWVEHIMPVQLLRLGPVVIAGMSGEATTVAGRRVRRQVLAALAALGIERVIVAPYANSYSGYCVTPEEYQQQNYEGGHTLFGPYTLGAYQALFAGAAAALVTQGDIFVVGARQQELLTFLNVFRKVGGEFEVHDDGIRFRHPGGQLKPVARYRISSTNKGPQPIYKIIGSHH
jgi:hypothetical protein